MRKRPRQARAAALFDAILEAAVQVLARDGAERFNTAAVAERAGVSVGSLYQYFPNKAAILFRLQSEEWRRTTETMRALLDDGATPPHARLRAWVHAFLRSECEEAAVRAALGDAAPLYRREPEAREARASVDGLFERFLDAAAPRAAPDRRALAGRLVRTTLSEVGRRFSEQPRVPEEIAAFAEAMADMFSAYLDALDGKGFKPGGASPL